MTRRYELRQEQYRQSRDNQAAKKQERADTNSRIKKDKDRARRKARRIKKAAEQEKLRMCPIQPKTQNMGFLTEHDVEEIIWYGEQGRYSLRHIARHYRKNITTIQKVLDLSFQGIPAVFKTNRPKLVPIQTQDEIKQDIALKRSLNRLDKQFHSSCATIRANGLSVPNRTVPTPTRDL